MEESPRLPAPEMSDKKITAWWRRRAKWVVVGLVVLVSALAVMAIIASRDHASKQAVELDYSDSSQRAISESAAVKAGKNLSGGKCEGEGPVKLSSSPMDPEDFSSIVPYGLMVGGHVTPIDHQYFSPLDYDSPRDAYEVYAMADGTITEIGRRVGPPQNGRIKDEYRLVFTETCTFFYYYDLVTSLSPELKATYDANAEDNHTKGNFTFPVEAGQLIGRIGGQTLDFAVWDTTKPLSGFINPDSYKAESWKIFTADPLDYYTDELKELLLSRYLRTVPPVSGKIDYDEKGKLIGNWFVEGTNGYEGLRQNGHEGYWGTHLAIAPEHLDPSAFVVSIGDYGGEAAQFATKTNSPWPADVTETSGLIKYELVQVNYRQADGGFWDRKSMAEGITVDRNGTVQGTALAQLIEGGNKLRFEAFPGKRATQVSDFTTAAKIYTR